VFSAVHAFEGILAARIYGLDCRIPACKAPFAAGLRLTILVHDSHARMATVRMATVRRPLPEPAPTPRQLQRVKGEEAIPPDNEGPRCPTVSKSFGQT